MLGERNYDDSAIGLVTMGSYAYILTSTLFPKYTKVANGRDMGIYSIFIETGYKSYFNYIGSDCDDIPIGIRGSFKGIYILSKSCFPLSQTFNSAVVYTNSITSSQYTIIMITARAKISSVSTFNSAATGKIALYALPSEGGLVDFLITSSTESSFKIEYILDYNSIQTINHDGNVEYKLKSEDLTTKCPSDKNAWYDYKCDVDCDAMSVVSSIDEYIEEDVCYSPLRSDVYYFEIGSIDSDECSTINRYIYRNLCLPACPSNTYEDNTFELPDEQANYVDPYSSSPYGLEFNDDTTGLYQTGVFESDESVDIPALTFCFWAYVNSDSLNYYTLLMIYNAITITETTFGDASTTFKASALIDTDSISISQSNTAISFYWKFYAGSFANNGKEFILSGVVYKDDTFQAVNQTSKSINSALNFKNFIFFGADYNSITTAVNNKFIGYIKEFKLINKYIKPDSLKYLRTYSAYPYMPYLLAYYRFNEKIERNLENADVAKFIDYSQYGNNITYIIYTTTPQISNIPTFLTQLSVFEFRINCVEPFINKLDNIDTSADGDDTTLLHRAYTDIANIISVVNNYGTNNSLFEFRHGRCTDGILVDSCVIDEENKCIGEKLSTWSSQGGKHYEICYYESGLKNLMTDLGQVYLYERPKYYEVDSTLYMAILDDIASLSMNNVIVYGGDLSARSEIYAKDKGKCGEAGVISGTLGDVCWSAVDGGDKYIAIPNGHIKKPVITFNNLLTNELLRLDSSNEIGAEEDNYIAYFSSAADCVNIISPLMTRKNGFFPYFYYGNGIFAVKNYYLDIYVCDIYGTEPAKISGAPIVNKITPELIFIYPPFENPIINPTDVISLQFDMAIKFTGAIYLDELDYNVTNSHVFTDSSDEVTLESTTNTLMINTTFTPGRYYSFTLATRSISDTLSQSAAFFSTADMKFTFFVREFQVLHSPISLSYKLKEFILHGANFITYSDPVYIYLNNMITYRTAKTSIRSWVKYSDCHPILYPDTDDHSTYSESTIKIKVELNNCTSGVLYANISLIRKGESAGCSSALCTILTEEDLDSQRQMTIFTSVDNIQIGEINCAEHCLLCSSNDCLLCNQTSSLPFLYAGTCISGCPSSFPIASEYQQYLNDISYNAYKCVSQCHEHQYYDNITKYCRTCSSTCAICNGPDNNDCVSCYTTAGSSMYLYQGICFSACPAKTTLNNYVCLPNSASQINVTINVIGAKAGVVLADSDVVLRAIIGNTSTEITSIEWSVYPYDESINEDTSGSRLFFDPDILNQISVKLNSYYFSSYDYSREVSISVAVSSIDATGTALIKLKSIDPPIIGNFYVSPTSGSAMADLFTITLSDWKSGDSSYSTLIYEVELSLSNGQTVGIISPTSITPTNVQVLIPILSPSNVVLDGNLVAKVYNEFGGVSQSLKSIQIKNTVSSEITTNIIQMIKGDISISSIQAYSYTASILNSLDSNSKQSGCLLDSDCLNDGRCSTKDDGTNQCDCTGGYSGAWCEVSTINGQMIKDLTTVLINSFTTYIGSNALSIDAYKIMTNSMHLLISNLADSQNTLTLDKWSSACSIFNSLYLYAKDKINDLYNYNLLEAIVFVADDLLLIGNSKFSTDYVNYSQANQSALEIGPYNKQVEIKTNMLKIISNVNHYIDSLAQFTSTATSPIEISAKMFSASIHPFRVNSISSSMLLGGYLSLDPASISSLNGPQEFYVKLIDWKSNPYLFPSNSSSISHIVSVSLLDPQGDSMVMADLDTAVNIVFQKQSAISDMQCVYYDNDLPDTRTVIEANTVVLSDLTITDEEFKARFPEISIDLRRTDFTFVEYSEVTKPFDGGFSNKGCTKILETDTQVVCRCNHLTDIATAYKFGVFPDKVYSFFSTYDPIVKYKKSLGFYIAYALLIFYGAFAVLGFVLDLINGKKCINAMMELRGAPKSYHTVNQTTDKTAADDIKETTQNDVLNVTKHSNLSDNSLVNITNPDVSGRLSDLNSDKEVDNSIAKSANILELDNSIIKEKELPHTPTQKIRQTGQYKQKSGKKIAKFVDPSKIKNEAPLSISIPTKTSVSATNTNPINKEILSIISKGTTLAYTDYYSYINKGYIQHIVSSKNPTFILSKFYVQLCYYFSFYFKNTYGSHFAIPNILKVYSLSMYRVARVFVAYLESSAYLMVSFIILSRMVDRPLTINETIGLGSLSVKYIWVSVVALPIASLVAFIPAMIMKVRVDYSVITKFEELQGQLRKDKKSRMVRAMIGSIVALGITGFCNWIIVKYSCLYT